MEPPLIASGDPWSMSKAAVLIGHGDGIDALRRLIQRDPGLVRRRDKEMEQRTALHHACIWGYLEAAELLLDHGADINAVDSQGSTPLMWACAQGHGALARLLLRRGANPRLVHESGISALGFACRDGNVDTIRALLRDGRCRVDETNHYGARALYWPCYYGYHEAAKVLLLEGGADPCHLDGMGRSPLEVAAEKGHHQCVTLLQWFMGETCRWEVLVKARVVEDDRMQHLHHNTLTLPDPYLHSYSATTSRASGGPPGAAARRGQQECHRRQRRRGMVTVTAPAYLRERVEEGTALPWVQFHEPSAQAATGGNNQDKDKAARRRGGPRQAINEEEQRPTQQSSAGEGAGDKAEVLGAVLRHVVLQMKDDPFKELMSFMRLR